MFSKLSNILRDQKGLGLETAEQVSDLLYDIGKSVFDLKNHESALVWLNRSYELLCQYEVRDLSPDAVELRVSILVGIGT